MYSKFCYLLKLLKTDLTNLLKFPLFKVLSLFLKHSYIHINKPHLQRHEITNVMFA